MPVSTRLGCKDIEPETVQKLDSVDGIPDLQQVGQAVAKRDVRAENFERFPA